MRQPKRLMLDFTDFCQIMIAQFGSVSGIFEMGMYQLMTDLQRILELLKTVNIDFELVGGVAVNAHLLASHASSRSFLTRDIDILIRRTDLDRLTQAAAAAGYTTRRMVGGYLLQRPGQAVAESVHLLFTSEVSHSAQPEPHPQLNPENVTLLGLLVPIAPLADLVRMKLTSYRIKDLVHLQVLDAAGLITPGVEATLPATLKQRLAQARAEFAAETNIDTEI